MTETTPPNDPADESGTTSWNRQPSSAGWPAWGDPAAEPPTAYTPPPSNPQNYAPPAQNYPPPQGYSATPGYPSQSGYQGQPGYPPPAQNYQGQGYPAPAQNYPTQGYPPPGQYGQGYPPAFGSPYPGGYADPGPRRFDGISIAAFVLGIIAFVPFAVGFGIAGLVRTQGGRRRGRWMAVTGMILAVAWVAGIVALAVTNQDDATRSADGTISKSGTISPWDVKIGDCVELPTSLTSTLTLSVTPCSEPHNAQAFAVFQLPGSSYPGEASIRSQASKGCQQQVADYVNSDTDPKLHVVYLYPSSSRWKYNNDHTAHCLLVDREKEITGDIREDR